MRMSTAIASADLVLELGTSLSGLNADQVFVAVDHDDDNADAGDEDHNDVHDDGSDDDDGGGSDC